MILPIYGYGHPVLKKKAVEITPDYPDLATLIENMWETMYNAEGVGLAAPQVGLSIRLFLVDTTRWTKADEEGDEAKGIKKVFINARKVEETGELWPFEEGCLSIPDIRGDVERPERITLHYFDENFIERQETFSGLDARVIQHEYDHIEGRLFTELLNPLKRKLIKGKLERIRKGLVKVDYPMRFATR
ncbi:MAG: peptide deformylase [Saprospiraceae bacterium]|nr:MAG: peptide deformylase [Saprospiraceae bacterium]